MGLASLASPLGLAAQTAPNSVTVTMTDSGYSPAGVTVPLGGSVTWVNKGSTAHSATTVGGAPTAFNTPGVGPGQSTSLTFSIPGNYYYTSGADCAQSFVPTFPCTVSFLVTVLAPGGAMATATPDPNAPPGPVVGPRDVTVVIDDSAGFVPAAVTIPTGGTVTWKNRGAITHNATNMANAPATFNTAGIGPGASAGLSFTVPGQYFYTSGIDCISSATPTFPCGNSYLVTVVGPGGFIPTATPQVGTVPATPVALPQTPAATASIDLSEAGISPPTVFVALGGVVTWTNRGKNVHSATSTLDATSVLPNFDSGGLGPGQTFTMAFGTPGTYAFTSAPDCLNPGGPQPGFACNYYSVIVSPIPLGALAQQTPTPTPTPLIIPGSAAAIVIDDVNGFSPASVTVRPNSTVTWVNYGSKVHTAVVNQNPLGAGVAPPFWLPYALPTSSSIIFDSGGLNQGQSYSFVFTTVGTYPYHSSTEQIFWVNNGSCGCTITTFNFFGTVTVSLS